MTVRHFLSLRDCSSQELKSIVARAGVLKRENKPSTVLAGKTLALVFEKSSTRTRTSFEVGMTQLGGSALFLSNNQSQIQRGEPLKDTARVLSSMVDAISMRTEGHNRLLEMAKYSKVPVINALCDTYHPCQLLADMQTYSEHKGCIEGARIAWIGDGNNVCHSWMNAASLFGFELAIATPENYQVEPQQLAMNKAHVDTCSSPAAAVLNADCVVTDTWASMGQEDEKAARMAAFEGYCVDDALLAHAKSDAIFMHCLPAYRGYEVSEAVLEGPQSVVWDEAENRLHAQKALLEFLLADA